MSFLSRWRPRQLLLAWVAYWIVLVLVKFGGAIGPIYSATHAEGNHGEINASFGDGVLSLTVKEMGRVTWTQSVHFLTAALWLALPPLVLWLVWVRARSGAIRSEQAGMVRT